MSTEHGKDTNSFAFFNLMKFIGSLSIAIFLHYNDHFLVHLGIENPFNDNMFLLSISHNSYVFVEMYFMISGILFSYAYLEKIKDGMKFDSFLLKRFIRIFPLLIITSVVMYLGNTVLYKYNGTLWSCGTLSLWDLCVDILFGGKAIFNAAKTLNAPIWYINVLMLCYIIAFILTKFSKKISSTLVFAGPILLGLMMQYSGTSFVGWNEDISRGYIAFFIGNMLGIFFQRIVVTITSRQMIIFRVIALLELIVALWIRLCPLHEAKMGNFRNFYTFLVFPGIILLFYNCNWINKLCSTKLIKWMGNISFSVYLWNFPIYLGIHLLVISGHVSLDVTSTLFFILVVAVHLVVASISYYLIDNKLGKMLTKLIQSIPKDIDRNEK